jgi:hypothetical protein
MSELTSCIEHVRNMMSKTFPPITLADIRPHIVRLFEEGVTMKPIVDLLVKRQHDLHEEMVLGLRNHDHLSPDDFKVIERILGVNELTPENREHWEAKFKSGRARYWCPQCGYSGNEEFPKAKAFGPNVMFCYQCGLLVDDSRYFTLQWTHEEQKAHEVQRDARRAELEAKRLAEAELRRKQESQTKEVRSEAVTAVKAIDEFQWVLEGDDEESFVWDEHNAEKRIRRVSSLMLRPLMFGKLPVPADDVVAYFKGDLKPADGDDLQAAEKEFNRCAQSFDKMTMEMEAEND